MCKENEFQFKAHVIHNGGIFLIWEGFVPLLEADLSRCSDEMLWQRRSAWRPDQPEAPSCHLPWRLTSKNGDLRIFLIQNCMQKNMKKTLSDKSTKIPLISGASLYDAVHRRVDHQMKKLCSRNWIWREIHVNCPDKYRQGCEKKIIWNCLKT